MTPPKIYVAGPYTLGDVAVNVRAAIDAANQLLALGFIPFVPHLSHFWHMIAHHPYEDWIRYDLQWLEACDAVLRLPGESKGADLEVKRAGELHIPVYPGIDWVVAAFPQVTMDSQQ